MKFTKFNSDWKFWEVTDSFALNWDPPEDAVVVQLPHDAMIERPQDPDSKSAGNTGYRNGGLYSYSKKVYLGSPDRTYILKVEGAYMNAYVYVNGELAAKRPYGYSVFYVPLNPFAQFGMENEIRVQVRAGAEPNSRWYPGTGLYRDVYLLESGKQYIKPDSVQIKTAGITAADENTAIAKVDISAMISDPGVSTEAAAGTASILEITLTGPDGKKAASAAVPVDGIPAADDSVTGRIFSDVISSTAGVSPDICARDTEQKYYTVSTQITVADPLLWDDEAPNLYTCSLALKDAKGELLDTHTDEFGIRILDLSTDGGLRVNGKEVKLRGACIHHDSGMLGSKTFEEVHLRQISILKEAGFNAIRSSHNPAAPALLRACDKVGMYVMDETFDMWTRHKSDYDYGMYFEEWWEADVEAMVRNSFNHPCVLMYSIGNEIPEIGSAQGGRISKMICDKIHSIDDTRYTLASVNGTFSVGGKLGQIVSEVAADLASQGHRDINVNDFMGFMHEYMGDIVRHPIVDDIISVPFQHTDIAGYNYMGTRYDIEHELHPERIIVGSETGIGELGYNWERVCKYPYVIGDFCWTGWEYLGEAGIGMPNYSSESNPFGTAAFPLQISGTGCIDITGHRLAMSYYRQIIFGLRKDPYIAVKDPDHYGEELIKNPWIISDAIDSWSWPDHAGKPVMIEVYSDGDEVELLKNGVSLGRKPAGMAVNYISLFDTIYEPGTLTAISYKGGAECGRYEVNSASEDLQLILEAEPAYSRQIPAASKTPGRYADICRYYYGSPASPETAASQDLVSPAASGPNIPSADQMMARYQVSAEKNKEFTQHLKEQYLNGKAGRPELVLDISKSQLMTPDSIPEADPTSPDSDSAAAAPTAYDSLPPSESGNSDDYEIRYVKIALADAAGIPAADKDVQITLTIEGGGETLAFGSADPWPTHNYNETVTRTWRGRAQLIIKKYKNAAPVRIKVDSETGLSAVLEI